MCYLADRLLPFLYTSLSSTNIHVRTQDGMSWHPSHIVMQVQDVAELASTSADVLLLTHAHVCGAGFPFKKFLAAAVVAPPFSASEAADTLGALSLAEVPVHIVQAQASTTNYGKLPTKNGALPASGSSCNADDMCGMQLQDQDHDNGVHLPGNRFLHPARSSSNVT
jgi:hypothetical protein